MVTELTEGQDEKKQHFGNYFLEESKKGKKKEAAEPYVRVMVGMEGGMEVAVGRFKESNKD